MKGFEVHNNGKTTKIAVKDGMITIHLFVNNGESRMLTDGESRMYVGGVDYTERINMAWYDNTPINIGDKFEVKVTEINEPSVPAKIIEDKSIKRPKTKLEFFRFLEHELKKQGLI